MSHAVARLSGEKAGTDAPRLAWWSTDLVDPEGGVSKFQDSLPDAAVTELLATVFLDVPGTRAFLG